MRNIVFLPFFIFVLFSPFKKASAQDTIILMNGKRFEAKVLEIRETTIKYKNDTSLKSKIHSIKSYRVFSVSKSNGIENIIFKPDTIEDPDLNINQMRLFIKGEQAAQTHYHNSLNKAVAFVVGAGSSFFSIYGLVGPALYSSIVGSVDPDINKQKGVDPLLINIPEYREGYLKISRDKKIRNSFVAGMIGFAVGFTTLSILGNNSK